MTIRYAASVVAGVDSVGLLVPAPACFVSGASGQRLLKNLYRQLIVESTASFALLRLLLLFVFGESSLNG